MFSELGRLRRPLLAGASDFLLPRSVSRKPFGIVESMSTMSVSSARPIQTKLEERLRTTNPCISRATTNSRPVIGN